MHLREGEISSARWSCISTVPGQKLIDTQSMVIDDMYYLYNSRFFKLIIRQQFVGKGCPVARSCCFRTLHQRACCINIILSYPSAILPFLVSLELLLVVPESCSSTPNCHKIMLSHLTAHWNYLVCHIILKSFVETHSKVFQNLMHTINKIQEKHRGISMDNFTPYETNDHIWNTLRLIFHLFTLIYFIFLYCGK